MKLAGKAAVRVFTKSTALQFAKDGIRANSVHPGPADTEMLAQVYSDPELRRGRGAELVVDGGLTAQ